MAGEYPQVPNEAKAFNDMVAWAADHGKAESVRDLLDAAKAKDWDSALDAVHKLEGMSELADKAGAIGDHFDTIDKVGKALEIAQAVEKGDYAYAGTKLGAEVVDSVASGYLDSLGPGGMMLNYAVHESGEVMSSYLTEAQQFGPDAALAEASGNEAAVAAYKTNREYMEGQIREQVEAGRSPEEVQAWTRDHMEAHGALYKNLDGMADQGDAFANRFEKDIEWSTERTEAITQELEAQPAERSDSPGFFGKLSEKLGELGELIDPAQEQPETAQPESVEADEPQSYLDQLKDAAREKLHEFNEHLAEQQEQEVAPEADTASHDPEPVAAQQAAPIQQQAALTERFPEVEEQLDVTIAAKDSGAEVVAATAASHVAEEVIEIPLQPPVEASMEQPIEIPLEPATEVVLESQMTETEKLDAYVSQMAREAEAESAAQALAEQAPPPATEVVIDLQDPPQATEVVIVDADTDIYEMAEPWEDHQVEPAPEETSDDTDNYA
ncbi:MAG: hypothetical protein AB8B93_05015 [Pseudomonadales bacterium]